MLLSRILRRQNSPRINEEILREARPIDAVDCSDGDPGVDIMGRADYTGLLYSQPTMLQGIARTLDIGGTFDSYNTSASPTEADWLAIASDWYAVSADYLRAVEAYRASQADAQ